MGGTFDPIHTGHLTIAEFVMDRLELEKILFIPAGIPNFKQNKNLASVGDRYIMTCLATVFNHNFEVSAIETDRKFITYTYDTIRTIKKLLGDAEIYYIIGSDIIDNIHKWYKFSEIVKLCKFALVNRAGHDDFLDKIEALRKNYNIELEYIPIPGIDISSTMVRENIKAHKSIKYLVPDAVENYILKNSLYNDIFEDYIKSELKKFMSDYRYNHTLGVVSETKKLAAEYDEDIYKAMIAAYLHDLAKEFPPEKMLEYSKKYNIDLNKITENQFEVAHGFISAEIARDYYGILDEEILDAIRYHSTGRKNMTVLDKIIYIADAIEPNRKNDSLTENLRELAYSDIDKAIVVSIEFIINSLEKKGKNIHSLSKKALKYLNNI